MSRRSAPHEDRMVSCLGLHPIWNTSSVWLANVCSRCDNLRMSNSRRLRTSKHSPPRHRMPTNQLKT